MSTFEARWPGWCGECEEAIEVGQVLTYRGRVNGADVVAHEICPTVERAPRPTCATCWQEVTPASTCGCDA